jgi:uncharacterized lipoprotein YddW (UPF0748 family)
MNKRDFLRVTGLVGLALASRNVLLGFNRLADAIQPERTKHWAWIGTDLGPSMDEWSRRFAAMKEAGIDAVIPEVYASHEAFYGSSHLPVRERWLEKILPIAKKAGLEVHAWMWCMPCNNPDVSKHHPDWFVVNGRGESAAVKPAYVPYYKFMCPSHPEVQEFIRTTVSELARYDELDGIHLDYIRFPDVILAKTLQPKYGITQDREYPEYDYCYCELCRTEFSTQTGIDIAKETEPSAVNAWRQFRYDRITHLVKDILIPTAHERKKAVSAAVFPNWEMVRQEWACWGLDAVLPMLYNSFYGEGIDWIERQTAMGVKALPASVPLYSGLLVAEMTPEVFAAAIKAAQRGGAHGVALFTGQSVSEQNWKAFSSGIKVFHQ